MNSNERFLIRAIKYLSRGKITDPDKAAQILAGVAFLFIAISIYIFIFSGQSEMPVEQIGIKSHEYSR